MPLQDKLTIELTIGSLHGSAICGESLDLVAIWMKTFT